MCSSDLLVIIYAGVRNGIERVSKFMMPILVVLSVIIAAYSVTRPGAIEGVKYFLVPNVDNFSWMTVVSAMGQMFYSLSIAMGILITFGSYMKKDISIEDSTQNVEIFDTAIAIMAGSVSYTHLDVYKRQDPHGAGSENTCHLGVTDTGRKSTHTAVCLSLIHI